MYSVYFVRVKKEAAPYLLGLILLLGGVLRFWDFAQIPLSHDEFSVLFRLGFPSWEELIRKGVLVDTHPAGIQVFLHFWTQLNGSSESWILKLPFAFFGMGAVYCTYWLGTRWFHSTVGLVSAAYMSTLQYPIMYSQLARPYISGLFFCLLAAIFWTRILQAGTDRYRRDLLFFILSSTLCLYNHHFSALMAALIGLTGLFWIPKNKRRQYLMAGGIIFLLYVPHLPIFLHQLSKGGVGGWLGAPSWAFPLQYFRYVFHFNAFLCLIPFLLIWFLRKRSADTADSARFLLISWLWFLSPLIIGWVYSVLRDPILQYSVLLFSFPFMLYALFGGMRELKPRQNALLIGFILSLNTVSLVEGRKHFTLFYSSIYQHILTSASEQFEREDRSFFVFNSHERISQKLLEQMKTKEPVHRFWYNDSAHRPKDLRLLLHEQRDSLEAVFLGSLSAGDARLVPMILEDFPMVERGSDLFGGSVRVFTRSSGHSPIRASSRLDHSSALAGSAKGWNPASMESWVDRKTRESPAYSFRLSEWGPSFQAPLWPEARTNDLIDLSVDVRALQPIQEALLVIEIWQDDELLDWTSSPFQDWQNTDATDSIDCSMHHSYKLSDLPGNHKGLQVKAYVWNKGMEAFEISRFHMTLREGNPYLYGLYEALP